MQGGVGSGVGDGGAREQARLEELKASLSAAALPSRSLSLSLARSLALSFARSLALSLSRSLALSLARSPSHTRALTQYGPLYYTLYYTRSHTQYYTLYYKLTSLRKKAPAAAAPSTGGETSTKGRGGGGGGAGGESMAEVLKSFPMPNFKDSPSGVDIVVTVRELERKNSEKSFIMLVINIKGR